jgi:hypothetical protein
LIRLDLDWTYTDKIQGKLLFRPLNCSQESCSLDTSIAHILDDLFWNQIWWSRIFRNRSESETLSFKTLLLTYFRSYLPKLIAILNCTTRIKLAPKLGIFLSFLGGLRSNAGALKSNFEIQIKFVWITLLSWSTQAHKHT